jgi:AraC-like DNA-binding protein
MPPASRLGRERSVRVTEYRCPLAKGAPVEVEQFAHATISLVRSGAFGFRSDRDDQLLSVGFLLLANPGQTYETSHEHCGRDRCLTFRFDEAVLEEVGARDPGSRVRRYFARSVLPPLPRADALRHLVEQRLVDGTSTLGLEEVGLALAACVLAHTDTRRAAPVQSTHRTRDAMFTARAHLEHHAADEISLADAAAVVDLTPYHFVRVFKRETGVTPYRFVMQTRIRNAIALLRDTTQPVTEIAYAVGFGDLSNFINFFRREVGCSPSQFRKAEPGAPASTRKIYQAAAVRPR